MRADLCDEAVALARLVAVLLPDEPEALGLAALVLAHDARRAARVDGAGRAVPLDAQDRSRYDVAKIAEAGRLLARAMLLRAPGPYQLQAAIAHLHATAASAAATDWPQIALLYGALRRMADGPVVALDHASAVGLAGAPRDGLALLGEVRGLDDPVLLHATRADLLRRAGRTYEARSAYGRALELAPPGPAREDLERRVGALL